MTFYEIKDGSFIINNEWNNNYYINENTDTPEAIHLTNNTVEKIELKRPEDVSDGFCDTFENRLDHLFHIKHRYRNLEDLHQYHFNREEMTNIFNEIFPIDSEKWDWDSVWMCEFPDTSSFHAFRDDDEFYILHKQSGTMINWYKHMGRTNTCNKDLSLEELKLFLLLLRKELVEEGIIKPEKGFEATKGLMK